MLVLSRKARQEIQIGEDVVVSILSIDGNRVRIGISAPDEVRITRSELMFDSTPTESPAFELAND